MADLGEALAGLREALGRRVAPGDFADVLRRRRRLVVRRTVAGMASIAVVAALAVAVGPRLTTTDRTVPIAPSPSSTPAPTGAAAFVPDVFAFTDTEHGAGFSRACVAGVCALVSAVTSDGGADWTDRHRLADTSVAGRVTDVAFAGADDGVAWGTVLYRTHDGGRTWALERLDQRLAAVAVADGTVWALTGDGRLLAGPADRDTLIPATVQPPTDGLPVAVLTRPDAAHAYLVLGRSGGRHEMVATTDGGRTWSPRPYPCATGDQVGQSLDAPAPEDVWLLCHGLPGAGSEHKALYESTDGGFSWRSLPAPADPGYADQLTVVSAAVAWRTGGRAAVYRTQSAGKSWTPLGPDFANAGGPRAFFALDATHAWAASPKVDDPAAGMTLYRTTDGVIWTDLSTTGSAPSPTPTPTPRTPDVPPFRSSDVAFADAAHGLVLGHSCDSATCRDQVFATDDGGRSWSARPAFDSYPASDLGRADRGGPDGGARSLTAASGSRAWAWGPGLFVTDDRGGSWRRVSVADPVASVAVVGRSVWVLTQHCDTNGADCSARLLIGPIGPGPPIVAPVQPPLGNAGIAEQSEVIGAPADIVVGDAAIVYLSTLTNTGAGTHARLVATTDGGAHWSTRPDPCQTNAFGQSLSAGGATDLWLLCPGEPSAGMQRKRLYRSTDGGRTWAQRPDPGASGYGVYLAAVTGRTAWRYGARSSVLRSTDGGAAWQPSAPDFAVGDGTTAFAAVDATHAWAAVLDFTAAPPQSVEQVWRTTDGVHWKASRLAP